MNVAVVILNWNGTELLKEYLPSVVRYSPEATIYVADNASTDDSVAYIKDNFPQVRLIINNTNSGYAGGYNEALKEVEEELFVLLNNDVAVTENWLSPIIEAFKNNTTLGAAQPKILDHKRPEWFEYAGAAGGFIDKYGYPYCRGRIFSTLEKDEGQYNDVVEIFWATGACLFIRKQAFWDVGGFDNHFFAHQEEIDLCWRLHSAGYTINYIGTSRVYHLGGGTLDSLNPKKTFYNFRNTLLLLVKNRKGMGVWWLIFKRMLLDGIAGLQFLFQGKFAHLWAICKAHFSFYGLLPTFLKKRKKYASDISYFRIRSAVWNYFILKITYFNNRY